MRSPTTRNPIVKEAPDVEFGVSEQAVHLFHRMFALETIGRERPFDGVDGQRTGFDNPRVALAVERTRLACMSRPNISLMWLRIRSWLNMATSVGY